jgi:hypothetical protein
VPRRQLAGFFQLGGFPGTAATRLTDNVDRDLDDSEEVFMSSGSTRLACFDPPPGADRFLIGAAFVLDSM